MKIIGISSKKQGGKSFLAKNLCEILNTNKLSISGSNCKTIRMAGALKQVVIDCFIPASMGILSPDDLDSDDVKDTVLPCGHTIRYLLQEIGTGMFRGLWPDVWINAWLRKVSDAECDNSVAGRHVKFILCPDVRFPNELKAIHDLGGVVIRLTRAPFADVDQHESETALDEIARLTAFHSRHNALYGSKMGFDYVMDNKDFSMDDARRWAKDFVAKNYPDYV